MNAPLLVVTGTGTGIGKTVVSCGLVSAWAQRGLAVAGIKPIESGQPEDGGDVARLGQASTFHVTRFRSPYLLVDPVSPHLAARREGRTIELPVIVDWANAIRAEADAVVLELAGGLYSPVTDELTNADLLRALSPTTVVLVAPDRLGVLHDVIACVRAARSDGLTIDGVVLSAPEEPDSSTRSNATELGRVLPDVPVLAVLPRAEPASAAPRLTAVLDTLGL